MQKMLRTLKVSSLLAVLPFAASGQTLGAICESVARLGPGQWVEYNVTGMGMGDALTSMWVGNVGSEQRNGVEHTVYESRLIGAQQMVSQMVMTGESSPWDMTNLVEMTVQMAGQPPMTMSGGMLDMVRQNDQTPNIAEECHSAEVVGNESVTVPAGTISTLHLRHEDGEVWASPDIPMALVKFVSKEGHAMELKAHGNGATSSIN
jgi:hypothetical protein